MSYSFNCAGPIAGVRKKLVVEDGGGRIGRQARAAIHAELDVLEAAGATHVIAAAYANTECHSLAASGGATVTYSVARDAQAEALAQATQRQKDFEAWQAQGKAKGFTNQEANQEANGTGPGPQCASEEEKIIASVIFGPVGFRVPPQESQKGAANLMDPDLRQYTDDYTDQMDALIRIVHRVDVPAHDGRSA